MLFKLYQLDQAGLFVPAHQLGNDPPGNGAHDGQAGLLNHALQSSTSSNNAGEGTLQYRIRLLIKLGAITRFC